MKTTPPIALKDVVRLKGFYLNLNNERAEILRNYFEELSKVQTILQVNQVIYPLVSDQDFSAFIKPVNLDDLTNTALQNRPDYLITQQDQIFADQYLRYQKKSAVPDLDLITSYNQRATFSEPGQRRVEHSDRYGTATRETSNPRFTGQNSRNSKELRTSCRLMFLTITSSLQNR